MRRTALALVGIGLAAVVLAVFAVSYSNESAINSEDVVLESAAEDKLKQVLTNKVYVESDNHYASFSQQPNGDFSRRRQTAAAKTDIGDHFDDMFNEYFEDPAGTDLEKGLNAPKPKKATKETKVVEVIDVLKPLNKENTPKPNAENPPEVATVNGKDYEIGKVIKVQKDVLVEKEAAPASKPTATSDGTLILKGTPGAATGHAVADKKQIQDEKIDTAKTVTPLEDAKEEVAAKPAAKQETPPADAEVKPAVVKTTTPAAVPKIVVKPVAQAVSTVVGTTTSYSPFGNKKVATDSINMPPAGVDLVGKNHQEVGQHLILPPLVDVTTEPTILKEPSVKVAPTKAGIKAPLKPTATEAATPAVPAPNKSLPEDGVFGDVSKLEGGVWTNGNSDWSQASPWNKASKAPWTGGEEAEDTVMIAEPDSEDSQTPPWAQSGAEVEAPWEKQTANPKEAGGDLLQMAARSCAARKVQQKQSCNKVKAAAKSKSEHKSAEEHCASSAKATFQACFKDWQVAKKGTAAH